MQPLEVLEDSLFKIEFMMSKDHVVYDRTDYTTLEFLGDVSALYGAVYAIAHFLAFTVLKTGVLLDNHLINGIFKNQTKFTFKQWLTSSMISVICGLCKKPSKYEEFQDRGLRRLATNLDVVHLIKNQFEIH